MTGRYEQLRAEERVTLAGLRQQKMSLRAIGAILGRSASTISRELRRNTSMTDGSGSSSFAYGPQGMLTQQTATIQGISQTLSRSFDSYGRLVQTVWPGGFHASVGYDGYGRPMSLSSSLGTLVSTVAYQPGSAQPLGWQLGNGLYRTTTHDINGRLTNLNAGSVQSRAFSDGSPPTPPRFTTHWPMMLRFRPYHFNR